MQTEKISNHISLNLRANQIKCANLHHRDQIIYYCSFCAVGISRRGSYQTSESTSHICHRRCGVDGAKRLEGNQGRAAEKGHVCVCVVKVGGALFQIELVFMHNVNIVF